VRRTGAAAQPPLERSRSDPRPSSSPEPKALVLFDSAIAQEEVRSAGKARAGSTQETFMAHNTPYLCVRSPSQGGENAQRLIDIEFNRRQRRFANLFQPRLGVHLHWFG
jgi:hypothetical protein